MRRFLLLVCVLLILFIIGLFTVLGYTYVNGWVTGLSADGEYGMMYVAGGLIFAQLSPSLLLPYAMLFWLKPGRAFPSLLMAVICGALYPFLCLLLIAVLSLDPSESWATCVTVALVPGVILAFLGTCFGHRSQR